jgi:hypothetical protein
MREMVSGYLRRLDDWTALRAAIARHLGVAVAEVTEGEGGDGPAARVEASPQPGDFTLRLEVYVDADRAPGWQGEAALLSGLASELGVDVLYDDGASPNPYRWVLVRPDGSRAEVFEDAAREDGAIVLKPWA